LHIHIQSLSENFRNLVSDVQPYANTTLVQNKRAVAVGALVGLHFENLFVCRL